MTDDWEDPDFDDQWDKLLEGATVPRDFHSEYLSAPFLRCIDCETELLDAQQAYSVIKSYVARETVFEMAICGRCSMRLAESYSAESKAAFENSMRQWKQRQPPAPPTIAADPDAATADSSLPSDWLLPGDVNQLQHCASCGRSREACHRYSIVGTFLGRALVSAPQAPLQLPLLICDECNSAATENISRQTRDSWDRFVEDHFDGPPGIELDSPKFDPVLL
ncbi:MAG: hypothetical protein KDA75_01045 [Planctomycetaceae bacterium]|nr:hypothetical protein [Planctomycetaceae bacterium]